MEFNVNSAFNPGAQPEPVPVVNWNLIVPPLADNLTHSHGDEDGRHHQFHFERLSRLRRGRKLCCVLCKFIIFIMHLSLLVLLSGLVHA